MVQVSPKDPFFAVHGWLAWMAGNRSGRPQLLDKETYAQNGHYYNDWYEQTEHNDSSGGSDWKLDATAVSRTGLTGFTNRSSAHTVTTHYRRENGQLAMSLVKRLDCVATAYNNPTITNIQ